MKNLVFLGYIFFVLSGGFDQTSTIIVGQGANWSLNLCELLRADIENASPWIITTPCRRAS